MKVAGIVKTTTGYSILKTMPGVVIMSGRSPELCTTTGDLNYGYVGKQTARFGKTRERLNLEFTGLTNTLAGMKTTIAKW